MAVIDIDAHHGNGTQAIFWDDADVLTGSVHVDPGAPAGSPTSSASRTSAARSGSNRNVAAGARHRRRALGRGGDAAATWAASAGRGRSSWRSAWTPRAAIPRARWRSRPAGFRAAGRALGALGLPTVVVQEGGYDLDRSGALVLRC